jgi:hypothetical protein
MIPRRGHAWESKGGDYPSFPNSKTCKYRKRALAGISSRRAHRRLYPLTTGPHAHPHALMQQPASVEIPEARKVFSPQNASLGSSQYAL